MTRPAYTHPFEPGELREVAEPLPPGPITREWAWGGATGRGVRVAIVDSGVENEHPAIAGRVTRFAAVRSTPAALQLDTAPHGDTFGHGTACAATVLSLAPEVELYSVRVLGPGLLGTGEAFLAGLRWAIEQRVQVVNLSLGSNKRDYFGAFHELVDTAYFQGTVLVTAANNMPVPTYPSLYSSVISVAGHSIAEPFTFYCNPTPPVEFGAPGIDVRVAWRGGSYVVTTGNSFAAPHITGIVALILSKHPDLTQYQVKTVLHATASNVRRSKVDGRTAG
ncbi:MAG: S8 family serine peptidase [Chloroflexi bacterium]|nr:S8 family serine peptidase [Chloroflexota bacterium]